MLSTHKLEGEILKINHDFLYLNATNLKTIHLPGNLLNKTLKVPEIGTKIKIITQTEHIHGTYGPDGSIEGVALCPDCEMQFEGVGHEIVPNSTAKKYLALIKHFELTPSDLIVIHKVFAELQANFKSNKQLDFLRVISEYLRLLKFEGCLNTGDGSCLASVIRETIRTSPSDSLKLRNMTVEKLPHPDWSYGVQKYRNITGQLVATPMGTIALTSGRIHLKCQIRKSDRSLSDFLGKFVLITECLLMFEYFPHISNADHFCQSVCSVFFDLSSVKVLCNVDDYFDDNLSAFRLVKPKRFIKSLIFTISKKSMIVVNKELQPELWLEIINKTDKTVSLLCLCSSFTKYFQLFNQGDEYIFYSYLDFQPVTNSEMKLVNQKCRQYKIPKDGGVFVSHAKREECGVLDLKTNQNNRKFPSTIVTFKAKILQITFTPSFAPRVPAYLPNSQHFGTRARKKTHVLILDTNGQFPPKLYLNNWENLEWPNCLIPGAVAIFRNVRIESKFGSSSVGYFKSTPMTSYEILNYEPEISYSTANMSAAADNWGPSTPLGRQANIPRELFVWNVLRNFTVSKMRLSIICQKCRKVVKDGICNNCFGSKPKFSCYFELYETSGGDKCMIFATNNVAVKLFKVLFHLEWKFDVWFKSFVNVGQFSYTKTSKQSTFTASTFETNMRTCISHHLCEIDVKCRKLSPATSPNVSYLLIDVKKHLKLIDIVEKT